MFHTQARNIRLMDDLRNVHRKGRNMPAPAITVVQIPPEVKAFGRKELDEIAQRACGVSVFVGANPRLREAYAQLAEAAAELRQMMQPSASAAAN